MLHFSIACVWSSLCFDVVLLLHTSTHTEEIPSVQLATLRSTMLRNSAMASPSSEAKRGLKLLLLLLLCWRCGESIACTCTTRHFRSQSLHLTCHLSVRNRRIANRNVLDRISLRLLNRNGTIGNHTHRPWRSKITGVFLNRSNCGEHLTNHNGIANQKHCDLKTQRF